MKKVLAYHAEVHVERDGQILTLMVDRPDWEPEDVMLRALGRERGVGTVGELVSLLEGEGRVRVEAHGPDSFYCRGDRDVHGVGERLG